MEERKELEKLLSIKKTAIDNEVKRISLIERELSKNKIKQQELKELIEKLSVLSEKEKHLLSVIKSCNCYINNTLNEISSIEEELKKL
jgi:DNA-directed RNA polymerase specialized sigma subunit